MENWVVNEATLKNSGAIAAFFLAFVFLSAGWRTLLHIARKRKEDKISQIAGTILMPGYLLIGAVCFHFCLNYLGPEVVKPGIFIFSSILLDAALVTIFGEILFAVGLGYYSKTRSGEEFPSIFRQILKGLIYLIVFLSFMSNTYHVDITPLLTTSAVFTMVLGLALQDVLGNLFSGLSVHISPPFKIGDWIQINGLMGKVVESNWRATTLKLPSKATFILPNNDIARKDILNFSDDSGVMFKEFKVGLPYDVSPERIRNVLLGACKQVDSIKDSPAPTVIMGEFKDFAIEYTVRFWLANEENPDRVNSELSSRVWYRLKREGISVPFPIRDVYVHQEKDSHQKTIEHRLSLISGIDFLKDLEKEWKSYIAERLEECWYETGEVIVKENDADSDFFIVDRGEVAVTLRKTGRKPVAKLGQGEFFGEMSLLTGEKRSATVSAESETRLLKLSKDTMAHLLGENAKLAEKLSVVLSERNQQNQELIKNQSMYYAAVSAGRRADYEGASKAAILQKIRSFFKLY